MSTADISSSQATARENLGQQTSGVVAALTVIIKQSEPVRPYTGATSYRACKEYFLRICDCNGWNNSTDRARHLLVAMDGPAAEAVRGLILHREAWPKTDLKSPEADSLLRRKFVDGIADPELQKYLRLHAAKDDFATTVSKARHFIDASELSRAPKKPAIRQSGQLHLVSTIRLS